MNTKKILMTVLCAGAAAAATAEGRFSLKVEGLQNGRFAPQHILSENYGFGCSGGNSTPALSWKNPPKGTKSYVLTVYDPDAPHRFGLDALGGGQHSRRHPQPESRYPSRWQRSARRRRANAYRLWYAGLRRCLSAQRRRTPLRVHAHRSENRQAAERKRRCDACTGGLFTKANALGSASYTVRQGR